MAFETSKHSATLCPACLHKLDAGTSASGQGTPRPGSASVCLYCGELLIYRTGLKLELPTDAELVQWRRDKDRWSLLMRIREIVRGRRGGGAR